MHNHGQIELSVVSCGFHISQSHPYLGVSPHGAVYDPCNLDQPFGFLEIKCPYTACNVAPVEACTFPGFFCTTVRKADGKESVVLQTSHSYYAQVQGQMAIGEDHGVTSLYIPQLGSVYKGSILMLNSGIILFCQN